MRPVTNPAIGQLSIAYLVALACFLGLDACWLSLMSARLYQPALANLMAPTIDWPAAVLFYAVYLGGLLVFTVRPALQSRQPGLAARLGIWFGLVAYATYDLTNQATLANWPWAVTAADLGWGCVVSGVSAWAATWVALRAERWNGRSQRAS